VRQPSVPPPCSAVRKWLAADEAVPLLRAATNVRQVWAYLKSYQARSSVFPREQISELHERYEQMEAEFAELGLWKEAAAAAAAGTEGLPSGLNPEQTARAHRLTVHLSSFLRNAAGDFVALSCGLRLAAKAGCRSHWESSAEMCRHSFATFDLADMYCGLAALSCAVLAMACLGITSLLREEARSRRSLHHHHHSGGFNSSRTRHRTNSAGSLELGQAATSGCTSPGVAGTVTTELP
jgi:hypothetical protein